MCDPVTIAVVAASTAALSTTVGFIGQTQMAKANEQAADVAAAQQHNELGQRAVQVDAQQSENTVNAIIERAATQGTISASASAFNTGLSTTAQRSNAADFALGRGLSIADLNSQGQRDQIGNQHIGVEMDRVSQINSVQAPGALSLALGITQAGLTGANAYSTAGGDLSGGSKSKTKVA